ncbi:unnamed protein product [Nippostrongylus brasiliensis]|uniref:T-cell surface glycoprotein CD3 zeta chain n=1 Tax=Nippostrongylus brasiliensis TaxID=27835 RepID=A0A0N4XZ09_NIPBR|nr:unnamed protein product [Nippostrongylus brasiliensis]
MQIYCFHLHIQTQAEEEQQFTLTDEEKEYLDWAIARNIFIMILLMVVICVSGYFSVLNDILFSAEDQEVSGNQIGSLCTEHDIGQVSSHLRSELHVAYDGIECGEEERCFCRDGYVLVSVYDHSLGCSKPDDCS